MNIGILRTGQALPDIKTAHGDFDDLFRNLLDDEDFDFVSYAVLNDEFPDSITTCDAWLITGSASSSYENLPWITRLENFIRTAYKADIPMVGICFGHQILAQALGGLVEKSEYGWGIGPHSYDFDGVDGPVIINAWHQDQVTRLPDGATTVGRSAFCENAAIIYGKTAYSVQAHPEFHNEFISSLIDKRRNSVPSELVDVAEESLSHSKPSPEVVSQIKAFFKTRKLDIIKSTDETG